MRDGVLDTAPVYSDVKELSATQFGSTPDCLVAGFPCQDASFAGKRQGLDGVRTVLYKEALRLATEFNPPVPVLLFENVKAITSSNMQMLWTSFLTDLQVHGCKCSRGLNSNHNCYYYSSYYCYSHYSCYCRKFRV